jgi:hypothetical protein
MRVLERDMKRWLFLEIGCIGKKRTLQPPRIWTLETWGKCNDFDARMKMNIERQSLIHLSQLKLWEGDHESKPTVEDFSRPGY